MSPIRVLVVDDSAFMRSVITRLLTADPDLEVVDTARDGLEAVEKTRALCPDVVTLDVEMPRLDGLSVLRRIMAECPCPVVMVSSLTQKGAATTVRALALGAVDFVPKPSGPVSLDLHRVGAELVRKVKVAASVPRERLRSRAAGGTPYRRAAHRFSPRAAGRPGHAPPGSEDGHRAGGARAPGPAAAPDTGRAAAQPGAGDGSGPPLPARPLSHLVLIAASTGGPGALYRLLGALPAGFPAGVLVVQHMPAGFTTALAEHLDQTCSLAVREARAGDMLRDGIVLVAPGDHHLLVEPGGRLRLEQGPPRHGVRPAADVTMESIPPALAARTLALVLTGMGLDGARGARYLKERGAEIWIQDEASCVVYGMPRAVAALGLADRAGSPEQLATWLCERLAPGGPAR
ncbi:MAG TPA: chemotaxis response regulator protein-glutamate methylesterase [Thermaerobacter sp.]